MNVKCSKIMEYIVYAINHLGLSFNEGSAIMAIASAGGKSDKGRESAYLEAMYYLHQEMERMNEATDDEDDEEEELEEDEEDDEENEEDNEDEDEDEDDEDDNSYFVFNVLDGVFYPSRKTEGKNECVERRVNGNKANKRTEHR